MSVGEKFIGMLDKLFWSSESRKLSSSVPGPKNRLPHWLGSKPIWHM